MKNKYELIFKHFSKSLSNLSTESIGLAVSGGGDSLALLLAASKWASDFNLEVKVATVDHCLRPESFHEAMFVKKICSNLSFSHTILSWDKPKHIKNMQSAARMARLGLLANWAKNEKLSTILLGHSADDQAETILMNFIRGSGLEGLQGMPSRFNHDGINFYRPFLSVKRSELREYLEDHSWNWVEDPTNSDTRYQRVRVRKLFTELMSLGLSLDRIILTGERMRLASKLARNVSVDKLIGCLKINEWGEAQLIIKNFITLELETQLRILSSIIGGLQGSSYRPKYKFVRSLLEKMHFCDGNLCITKSGLKISRSGAYFVFQREINAIPKIMELETCDRVDDTTTRSVRQFIWDGRWIISVDEKLLSGSLEIGSLTDKSELKRLRKNVSDMKYYTAAALPAIFKNNKILAMPGLVQNESIRFETAHSEETFLKRLEIGH